MKQINPAEGQTYNPSEWSGSRTPPSQPAAVPVQVICSVLTNRQIQGPSLPF